MAPHTTASDVPETADVVVVGGGLAGLACARTLDAAGVDYVLLEASDALGGRVRTDHVDGFRLDRGFQVLLTEYPEARRQLDYERLVLRPFEPGAWVWRNGRFHLLADAFRRPRHALRVALGPIGNLRDGLRTLGLRRRTIASRREGPLREPDKTTLEHLRELGFSEGMIDSFFRPFFAGVFLEPELATSARWFDLLFSLFAVGDAAVPDRGMAEIPIQLSGHLDPARVHTRCKVVAASTSRVELADGGQIRAGSVVVATAEPARRRLLGLQAHARWSGTTCFYFAAESSPLELPFLALNGESTGPINNLAVMTDVAPAYSAFGEALISVTTLGVRRDSLEAVRQQLEDWFGTDARAWRHLKTYLIPEALPFQSPGFWAAPRRPETLPGIHICGDDLETASIQGALVSGRKTAERLLSNSSRG